MTVRVPANAVTEAISFSIQPISNMAGNGIGSGYRLEPNGKTFPVPLEISVRYNNEDLDGTIPEALLIAYQDGQGAWHGMKRRSQTNDSLTIETTHFTDFSILTTLKLSPAKATIRVGETINIEVVGCLPPPASWLDRFDDPIFGSEETKEQIKREKTKWCYLGSELKSIKLRWSADMGTLGQRGTR